MYILIEVVHDDSSMSVRYIGTFVDEGLAVRTARNKRNEFSRGITKRESGYDYKSNDSSPRMAWTDVVYSDGTTSHTWAVIDTDNRGYMNRWLG